MMKKSSESIKNAFKSAFIHTIPILTGFLFLGTTYGVYMKSLGFGFLYPLLMSITVFAGSAEFVAADMLLGAFDPLRSFLMTLMINARHLFYGISMLDKYKGMGLKKLYLIFGLCDESFSINCTAEIPENADKGWFMFFVTLLNQLYWVSGAALGALLGSFLKFNTEGLDFVMTAMFVVIFLENILKEKKYTASAVGVAVSVICLLIFGADGFIIPAMLGIMLCLTLLKKPLEKGGQAL